MSPAGVQGSVEMLAETLIQNAMHEAKTNPQTKNAVVAYLLAAESEVFQQLVKDYAAQYVSVEHHSSGWVNGSMGKWEHECAYSHAPSCTLMHPFYPPTQGTMTAPMTSYELLQLVAGRGAAPALPDARPADASAAATPRSAALQQLGVRLAVQSGNNSFVAQLQRQPGAPMVQAIPTLGQMKNMQEVGGNIDGGTWEVGEEKWICCTQTLPKPIILHLCSSGQSGWRAALPATSRAAQVGGLAVFQGSASLSSRRCLRLSRRCRRCCTSAMQIRRWTGGCKCTHASRTGLPSAR